MRKFVLLFLLLTVFQGEAFSFQEKEDTDHMARIEALNETSAYRWGPNCFNTALLVLGATKHKMFSSSSTMNSYVANNCTEISKSELRSGDLILYKELDQFKVWFYHHAAIYIDENTFFHKLGLNSLAGYEYFTPGPVENSREQYDFNKNCLKDDYQCYKPAFFSCNKVKLYEPQNEFEKKWNELNRIIAKSVNKKHSTATLSLLARKYKEFRLYLESKNKAFREWLRTSKPHWHLLLDDHFQQLYGYDSYPYKYSSKSMDKSLRIAEKELSDLRSKYINSLKEERLDVYTTYELILD